MFGRELCSTVDVEHALLTVARIREGLDHLGDKARQSGRLLGLYLDHCLHPLG